MDTEAAATALLGAVTKAAEAFDLNEVDSPQDAQSILNLCSGVRELAQASLLVNG
jgi:hypothetical protein